MLSISGKTVKPLDRIKLANRRLSGVSFTHDGKSALVGLRDDQGVTVLDVSGTTVKPTGDRVSTGVGPYAIDVSSDGHWAVVSDAGLASQSPDPGRFIGDVDAVTLIDVSNRPFRAVRHITVPPTPEGAALSPDGKWLAVQCLNGSNLTADNPGRQKLGKILLFAVNDDGTVTKTGELPSGDASQGLVFTRDSRTILVQFDVERALAVYRIENRTLVDTGQRIKLAAGPVSIRSMPR